MLSVQLFPIDHDAFMHHPMHVLDPPEQNCVNTSRTDENVFINLKVD